MEESRVIEMIKRNPSIITTINNPTDEMKLLALGRNGLLLKSIKNATKEMKELALENNVRAIQYIDEPSEEMMEYIRLYKKSNRQCYKISNREIWMGNSVCEKPK